MHLKYPLHVMKIGESWGAVPVGAGERRFNGYLRLNEHAACIIRKLQDDVTVEQLVSAVQAEYDGYTEKEIRAAVATLLAQLDAEGLLVR